MTHRYRAHGLVVASDVDLPLAPTADDGSPADLSLAVGPPRPVPTGDPTGERLARLAEPTGRVLYTVGHDGDRTVVRYPGLCEFVGDARLRAVTVHVAPDADAGVVSVLAAGALLAMHLRLQERLVLHASAVRVDGRAVAFVGASGMGKSTMATLLCAEGRALLSDDVLHVDLDGPGAVVHAGSTETRLREAARPLAAAMAMATTRATADGRLAVHTAGHAGGPLPLWACLVPQPRRDRDEVELRRLTPPRALMLLARFPRLPGWVEPAGLARDFQLLADLVERVPVLEARVPWGPPFRAGIAASIVSGLRTVTPGAQR